MTDFGVDTELKLSEKVQQNTDDQHDKTPKKSKSKRKDKKNTLTTLSDSTAVDHKETKIKPIIKNGLPNAEADISEDYSENVYYRKKRNKSVSFLIEDGEQVTKKSKSNSGKNITEEANEGKVNKTKHKKDKKSKEPENDTSQELLNMKKRDKMHSRVFRNKARYDCVTTDSTGEVPNEMEVQDATTVEAEDEKPKKKNKKRKKHNSISETNDIEPEPVEKTKPKNKKSHPKAEGDSAPVKKAKKETIADDLPETITDDLETLKIGDNPHSLTSLLDDMTVSEKNKQKKRKESKKSKTPKESTDENEENQNEEVKEKTKWKKRKWNKGRVGALDSNWLETAVIVENIPISCMLNYKDLLKNKFADVGPIKNIGIAELFPTVVSKPVFSTTVQFDDVESATKALEEDNTLLENSRIQVLRPLQPNSTTIVVRCYGELNDQNLSSIFNGAGKIRNIRHLDKGPKKMATTFIEFDGPESQEKAIEIGNGMKIGSKKLYVAKFEERIKRHENRENANQNIM